MVPPGDSVLGKTGIALEFPRGSYGRIAPRSSLAIRGIETGAGVIDRDFRGDHFIRIEIGILIEDLIIMIISIAPCSSPYHSS